MAKKSKIEKNERRKKLVAKYAEQRAALVLVLKDPSASLEDKYEAQRKISKMPRDASPVRVRNRCALTGRPRAFYRKFGISRITLREQALQGNLPGVIKASW
jgi:small subunit ribosomal protein S14